MHKLSLALVFILVSSVGYGQSGWQSATNVSESSTGDAMLTKCIYETVGGYRFSTTSRGVCKFSIEVNPETSQVRSHNSGSGSRYQGTGGGWQSATNVGEDSTGDAMLTKCIYETVGGYRFSTISKGICKFSIEVNPETSEVRGNYSGIGSRYQGSGGGWQSATNVGEDSTGDAMLTKCIYETVGGYRFSTTSRGICRFSVEINPETNKVR